MRHEDPILNLLADLYQQVVALTAENEQLRRAVADARGEEAPNVADP